MMALAGGCSDPAMMIGSVGFVRSDRGAASLAGPTLIGLGKPEGG